MKRIYFIGVFFLCSILLFGCSTNSNMVVEPLGGATPNYLSKPSIDYSSRLPAQIKPPLEKVVIIDPNEHVWGAYSADGSLVRAGLATAGSDWCSDIGRPCRTRAGTFRFYSLGRPDCKSSIFPIEKGGGAPMPHCMFFNGNQAMHGSYEVVEGNVSHGCVRLQVPDAEWLRYSFVNIGTKVIVHPY